MIPGSLDRPAWVSLRHSFAAVMGLPLILLSLVHFLQPSSLSPLGYNHILDIITVNIAVIAVIFHLSQSKHPFSFLKQMALHCISY